MKSITFVLVASLAVILSVSAGEDAISGFLSKLATDWKSKSGGKGGFDNIMKKDMADFKLPTDLTDKLSAFVKKLGGKDFKGIMEEMQNAGKQIFDKMGKSGDFQNFMKKLGGKGGKGDATN